MFGIAVGPFIGRQLDVVHPWWGGLLSAAWLLVLQAGMVIAGKSIAPVILLILIGDLVRQTWVVSMTSMAFA
jgi:hypothetical protein